MIEKQLKQQTNTDSPEIHDQERGQNEMPSAAIPPTILLRSILDATADGILVVDHRGKIVTFNGQFRQMWNIPSPVLNTLDDQLVIQCVLEQLKNPEDFIQRVKSLYSGDRTSLDWIEFKDGRIFERFSQAQVFNGQHFGRVFSFRDVTEQHQDRRELLQKTAELTAIVEAMPDLYFHLGPDGTILDHHAGADATSDLYVEPPVFLGKKMQDVLPPPIARQFVAVLNDFHRTQKPTQFEYSLDIHQREEFFEARIVPFQNHGAFVVVRKITSRVEAEKKRDQMLWQEKKNLAQVDAARKRFEMLAQASKILANSPDIRASLAAISSSLVPTFAGCVMIHLVDEQGELTKIFETASFARDIGKQIQAAMRSRDSITVIDRHLAADAPSVGADYAIVPLQTANQVLGTWAFCFDTKSPSEQCDLSFFEDLASRAALAVENSQFLQRYRKANQAKDDLLAVVSHDLRNPLTAIEVNATFLAKISQQALPTENLNQGVRRSAQLILRSAQQMTRLIQDLLDLAKMDSNHFTIYSAMENVCSIIEDVYEFFVSLCTERGIALHKECSVTGLKISCDRVRVIQVLTNLVSNAIKFTSTGGTIWLRVKPHDDQLLFQVQDTGIGILAQQLPHIFDRYWQASETRHLGSGLGLSIAQGIIKSHGGLIWVESEIHRGTTFSFTLPKKVGLP